MLKPLFIAVACCVTSFALAQPRKLPSHLRTDPAGIAAWLCANATTDTEKAAAIVNWVAHYLTYDDHAAMQTPRPNPTIADILRSKKGICSDYAHLVKVLCDHAGVEAHIINGYSKGTLTATDTLTAPDHSWNALRLEGVWQLADATWQSALQHGDDAFSAAYGIGYFCTPPQLFILNHLPADPIWQLSPTPVSAARFADPTAPIVVSDSMAFEDSIATWLAIADPALRKLRATERAYRFHPSAANARELSQTLLEYEAHLAARAEQAQARGAADSVRHYYAELIALCNRAAAIATLYPNQAENCAYNHFNYGVALYRYAADLPTKADRLPLYRQALASFATARHQLNTLPANLLRDQAILQCEDYEGFLTDILKN